jgi:hypothetical protein
VERLGNLLLLCGSVLAALLVSEVFFTLLLRRPALLRSLPVNLRSHVRNYYLDHDRDLLQADPQGARYDRELTYTLRPGRFRFRNREYDVELRVNHLGLRDTEEALRAPDVIVLGDSFAMGWGVAQEQAFPQRLAALTGLKVLNTGVPSYGTAREVKLLERLDSSCLRVLVVQYDDNDFNENEALERNGGHLPIRTREQYEATVRFHQRQRRYYLFKHTFGILGGLLRNERSALDTPLPGERHEAESFLGALLTSPLVRREDLAIVAFELNPAGIPDPGFPNALKEAVQRPGLPPALARLHVIDFNPLLGAEHYFDLDDHLNAAGHDRVARELARALAHLGALP